MKKYILLFIILAVANIGFSQDYAMDRADKYFEKFDFDNALEYYMSAYKSDPANPYVTRRIGESLRKLGEVAESAEWYQKTIDLDGQTPDDMLYLAEALKCKEDYEMAVFWYAQYSGAVPDDRRAKSHIENQKYYHDLQADSLKYILTKLDINTDKPSFGVSKFEDQYLFSSSGVSSAGSEDNVWDDLPYLDIYVCEKDDLNQLQSARRLEGEVNSKFHDGPAVYDANTQTIYVTRNNMRNDKAVLDEEGNVNLKIYTANKDESGEWNVIGEVPFNSDNFSNGHPCLSSDGRTMYFVSNRPGGYGATDIYKTTLVDGEWTEPENCGLEVNTEGNEMFPHISDEGKLFFASDGHVGLGGLDIFVTEEENSEFQESVNLGFPINSSKDDFSMMYEENNMSGYFSSNRTGKGKDNIYYFSTIEFMEQILAGTIKSTNPKQSLAGETITITAENRDFEQETVLDMDESFRVAVEAGDDISIYMGSSEFANGEPVVNFKVDEKLDATYADVGMTVVGPDKMPLNRVDDSVSDLYYAGENTSANGETGVRQVETYSDPRIEEFNLMGSLTTGYGEVLPLKVDSKGNLFTDVRDELPIELNESGQLVSESGEELGLDIDKKGRILDENGEAIGVKVNRRGAFISESTGEEVNLLMNFKGEYITESAELQTLTINEAGSLMSSSGELTDLAVNENGEIVSLDGDELPAFMDQKATFLNSEGEPVQVLVTEAGEIMSESGDPLTLKMDSEGNLFADIQDEMPIELNESGQLVSANGENLNLNIDSEGKILDENGESIGVKVDSKGAFISEATGEEVNLLLNAKGEYVTESADLDWLTINEGGSLMSSSGELTDLKVDENGKIISKGNQALAADIGQMATILDEKGEPISVLVTESGRFITEAGDPLTLKMDAEGVLYAEDGDPIPAVFDGEGSLISETGAPVPVEVDENGFVISEYGETTPVKINQKGMLTSENGDPIAVTIDESGSLITGTGTPADMSVSENGSIVSEFGAPVPLEVNYNGILVSETGAPVPVNLDAYGNMFTENGELINPNGTSDLANNTNNLSNPNFKDNSANSDDPNAPLQIEELDLDAEIPPTKEELADLNLELLDRKIKNVLFDFDESYVREDAREILLEVAKIMKENPLLAISVRTHCDSRGSNAYNEALSQHRAESVKNYLMRLGIEEDRLVTSAHGETELLVKCDENIECSEDSHQLNRRAELTFFERDLSKVKKK